MENITKEMINSREEWVFEYFFNKFYKEIYLFVCRYRGSNTYADDIVQATFIRFWAKAGVDKDFEHIGHVQRWLHLVAKSEMQKERGKLDLRHTEELTNQDINSTDLFDDIVAAQTILTVYGAILKPKKSMGHNTREILIERYLNGKKIREIAEARGVSKSTVKTLLKKGTDILRETLNFVWEP